MATGTATTGPTSTAACWIRPLLLLGTIAGGIAVALTIPIPPIDQIQAFVGRAGWAAPVLFAVVYAALTLTPTPATVLSIAAGCCSVCRWGSPWC
jgi:uncharacterized membrane protein YdjX (TVP38/TMEM64 family)